MPDQPTPAEIVGRSAAMARKLAKTARLHQEPEEAARFEQIATEGAARADRLEDLRLTIGETERQTIADHDAALRQLKHPWRRTGRSMHSTALR